MKKNYLLGIIMRLGRQCQPKLNHLFLCSSLCLATTTVVAQSNQPKVSLQLKNVSIPTFLSQLNKQVKLRFVYNVTELSQLPKISVNAKSQLLEEVLAEAFKGVNVQYRLANGVLTVRSRNTSGNNPTNSEQAHAIGISGTVSDDQGQPLEMATVRQLGTARGTYTNAKGEFVFSIPEPGELIVSYVGMEPQRFKINKPTNLQVQLKPTAGAKEVVVTGIVSRQKESFTGAAATFTGDELKVVGNNNVLQSLKSLDPSFVLVENNAFGSNPNVLPNIEVRGTTSISNDGLKDLYGNDPNQPLFILDGFETTLRVVADLDINRVLSITILKDAASTAMYGAKAANGVVVIETKKPVPGKLRLSYNGDFRVEMPDLSVYNMMNSSEKLEFERLAGAFSGYSGDMRYNKLKTNIAEGVDSYWLSEPVQVGFTNGHSIFVEGGDEVFRYGINLNYKKTTGAMKGSGRDTWGAAINMGYRKGKLNLSNQLNIYGYTANESNYGSFSDWVGMNPYYRKTGFDGSITKYVDTVNVGSENPNFEPQYVANPLYNASLPFINRSKNFGFRNNLQANVQLTKEFRIDAGLQLERENTENVNFKSALHTDYRNTDITKKGSYSRTDYNKFYYQGFAMLTYAKVWDKNSLTGNLRSTIEENTTRTIGMSATGFPYNSNGNPAFAFNYTEGGKPSSSVNKYRRASFIGLLNYMYDRRYTVDITYRLDGSSSFGVQNKVLPFWSIGAGYNIHNEDFIRDNYPWITILKLRGSYGTTANQGFGNFSSEDIYTYITGVNLSGQGVELTTIGNPQLTWQTTKQTNLGLDLAILNNQYTATVDAYIKNTDPLIVPITMPSSTGIYQYPINVGLQKSRGVEVRLKASPIYNLKDRIIWNVGIMGAIYKARYDGFFNTLYSLNKEQADNQSLQRYYDGNSPTAIWAVKSAGIDPGTGKEIYINKDGQYTYNYDVGEAVVVGDSRPFAEGTISTGVVIKNFSMNAIIRYRFGGDVYNQALLDRVENISRIALTQNQDKRALYERWKKPGDVSAYKAIKIIRTDEDKSYQTSRFVQRDNNLVGESFNLGYELRKQNTEFIAKLGMQSLRFNLYLNDIFRLSTVKMERGITYPFANTVAFSINALF